MEDWVVGVDETDGVVDGDEDGFILICLESFGEFDDIGDGMLYLKIKFN